MLSKIIVPVLIVIAAIGALLVFAPKKTNTPATGSFEWKVVQVKDNVSPPKYQLDVYLTGDKISEVSAVELDAALNSELIKLTEAETGEFYTNPLTVKMDTENKVFAIAKNPSNETPVDTTKPLFKLYFQAQSGFDEATFEVLSASQIYVRNTGGANPATTKFVLQK
jgi:hypothetical protein